ncbi:MAG: AraC family transcriptional regulator [Gammaproteobacteria bacterium]|nr:AraC family transcriptional regulator [Gammaproteobacteria bacterium]
MNKKAVIYATGERGVYVGRLERHFRRANVPSSLLVSLEDDLELVDPVRRDRITGKSFLIPAGMDLAVETHGAHVALFFLDELGTDLARLKPMMKHVAHLGDQYCFQGIGGESDVVQFANILRYQRPSLNTASQIVEDWLAETSPQAAIADPRILQAVHLIKHHYDQNISVEWIARQVGLSVPRLVQLFKLVTGTPIRRFRLWHRIFVTATKLNAGMALTDAAMSAGFSDYAQFSRTYRKLAGANPSDARDNTEIHISGYPNAGA